MNHTYIKSCRNCTHRKKTALEQPCSAGNYQMFYGKQEWCSYWKLHWRYKAKRFWDMLKNPMELVRLKLALAGVIIIIVIILDGR